MAPTVEKHEKKKSSIRRLLSPVIFSSIGGGGGSSSSSSSNDHGRGESFHRRRKSEQAAATSPSSSSSPSSPLQYCKSRGTPPATGPRGNASRGGSSVETAFVGTSPAERARVAVSAEKNCQRTSYGIPRRIIQRRQSSSSCGGGNNDETCEKRAAATTLYGNINRVAAAAAADVPDGENHNNYDASYRANTAMWDPENGNTTSVANHIVDASHSNHNPYAFYAAESNRVVGDKYHEYEYTGPHTDPKRKHRDGRSSAPPTAPYSQYYSRASSSSGLLQTPTSPSAAEPTALQNPSSNGDNKYATTRQWTAVVNERTDVLTTRCTTILRPQPLYSTATAATNATQGATVLLSHLRSASPSGAGYGYVARAPRSTLPVPVAPSVSSQPSPPQRPPFARSSPQRRTVSECDSTYSVVRKENNSSTSCRPSTPTATQYECVTAQTSPSGAIQSAATVSAPIFKRGTLQSPPSLPPTKPNTVGGTTAANISPKKVTFPASTASTAVYWPTRRGMTVDPPCRQSGQSHHDDDNTTDGATGTIDVEAAYVAIYENTGASVSPSSADSSNANVIRTQPQGGATADHQDHQGGVPFSPPTATAKATHPPSQIASTFHPPEIGDYAPVSVAHSTPYIPRNTVTMRGCDSVIEQRRLKGEARYQQLQQQRYDQHVYDILHSQGKSLPRLHDRRQHQHQLQLPSKRLEFESQECEYRSLQPPSESESGSEAGEIRKILRINGHETGARTDKEVRKSDLNRREDPRRFMLSSNHHSVRTTTTSFNSQNNINIDGCLDLEWPLSRGYPPLANSTLFDDDPGIMSEVETSSTGFRRGNKQRSSLPIVRTMSKTLERPLGLVFLQYRNETKRALLPNEITSLGTVKALFVRSFPKQLTMEYLDSSRVKIYMRDSNKDMFYELEDLRSYLNEIRDHSVLRLFELSDTKDGTLPMGLPIPTSLFDLGGDRYAILPTGLPIPKQRSNDPDQSYFSEPEFDSEFQHQHVHKSKMTKSNWVHQPYAQGPPGASATLPRGNSLIRSFSPAVPISATVISESAQAGFKTSSEKGIASARGYSPYCRNFLDDACYSQYSSRASSTTPTIDEETSDTEVLEDIYGLYSRAKLPAATETGAATNQSVTYSLASSTPVTVPPLDTTRLRVEHMERQLANLTGLVQKVLTQTLPTSSPKDHDSGLSSVSEVSFLDKSASFEKSGSSSDDQPEKNSPKQHSPQYAEDEIQKPALAPKPPPSLSPAAATCNRHTFYEDLQLTPEMYNQLRNLQKKTKDLHHELRNLRRMSQAQAHSIKESVRDTFVKIRSMVLSGGESSWSGGADSARIRITHEEEIYKEDINRLEDDLTELESTVEELRSNVINRKTRVNMIDVEDMALVLSKSSKTVADLRLKFPQLQSAMKSVMSSEMQRVIAEENFLKEEPERLESALRRCKKLTGTLVTLKRLASVQEQRLPDSRVSPTFDEVPVVSTYEKNDRNSIVAVEGSRGYSCSGSTKCNTYATSAFNPLLKQLQTTKIGRGSYKGGNSHDGMTSNTSNSSLNGSTSMLHHLHPLPSYSDSKPLVPERLGDLATRRVPPPPPLRTSSKSPLASPTSLVAPTTYYNPAPKQSVVSTNNKMGDASLPGLLVTEKNVRHQQSHSTSSSCESINSQEGSHRPPQMTPNLQNMQLEMHHQELLEKQRALQEEYSRLQQLHRSSPPDLLLVKKMAGESNTFSKMRMTFEPEYCATPTSGSTSKNMSDNILNAEAKCLVHETDIL